MKSKYFIALVLIVLGLADILIFDWYSNSLSSIVAVLGLHLIITGIVYLLIYRFLDKHNGVPNYLALFIPGLGSILVAVLHFCLLYFRRDGIILSDYERYINFERLQGEQGQVDYDQEIRTISFIDQLSLLDTKNKKHLIIDYGLMKDQGNVRLVQRGLSDHDNEVKYYSAVTINKVENEYVQLLNELREEFNANQDLNSLIKLAKTYRSYLESGLLEGEVYQFFNMEYTDTLKVLLARRKGLPEYLNELVKAYIRQRNYNQAELANTELLSSYPARIEGYLNEIQIAYETKDVDKIDTLLNQLKLNHQELYAQNKAKLSCWIEKEESV